MPKEVKPAAIEKTKPLTKKQQALLGLVFRFRFVTAIEAASYYGQPQVSGLWLRLEKLLKTGYLAKRYDGVYKIHGRPAEYYVRPSARHELRLLKNISQREIKQLYKRSTSSQRFVNRSLAMLRICNSLRSHYGDGLSFVTKVQLNYEDYDYLPRPLPDGFLRLETAKKKSRSFFIDYFDDAVSLGIHARRLKLYDDYLQDGDWDGTGEAFPRILIICQSPRLAVRFVRRARRFIDNEYAEIDLRVATLEDVTAELDIRPAIWVDPQSETDRKVAL